MEFRRTALHRVQRRLLCECRRPFIYMAIQFFVHPNTFGIRTGDKINPTVRDLPVSSHFSFTGPRDIIKSDSPWHWVPNHLPQWKQ